MLKNKLLLICTIFCSVTLSVASAAVPAPVYDLSQGGYTAPEQPQPADGASNDNTGDNGMSSLPSVDTSGMTLPERVSRLEQQMNNLVQMNLPQQVAELQQEVQQLRGQLQDLSHQQDLASQQQQRVEALPAVPSQLQTPPNPAIVKAAKAPPGQPLASGLPAGQNPQPTQTDTQAYQQAFSLLANKQYDESAAAFKDYLRLHPDGQFAPNAHYWLGDIYFQQKKFTQAQLELNLVISQYSASGKAPDASLKLAILHAQQGKTDQARQELKTVMVRYPGTPAAQLAAVQLQQLNSSGQ
ncbi:MAG: tol-pal system protein YbgF [Proteobacteria bacterium]|nr:tol-pal system protein YbgF [Pseudomonadota bacterium]